MQGLQNFTDKVSGNLNKITQGALMVQENTG